MTTAAQATAATIDVTLAGEGYRLSPLSDESTAELDNWLRGRIVRIAREAARDLPAEDRREIMGEAFDHASRVSWMMEPDLLTSTPDGIARFVIQLIRPKHAGFGLPQLAELMERDGEVISKVMDAFKVLQGKNPRAGAEASEPSPSTGTPSTNT